MTLQTRKPTGHPPWPILLLAGREKTGKSYSAAVASASDLVGRTLWIGIGEDDPDEYGALPGADFEIVTHDGTWRGIGNAIYAATQEPRVDGKPTLIILDSMTRLWDLIQDEMQSMANQRADEKAAKYNNKSRGGEDVQIAMDLWNLAKRKRWQPILDLLRKHDGPVILTARLELTTVMDQKGNPTKDKDWKIQAEKYLPYDVDGIVQLRARDDIALTGIKSTVIDLPIGETKQWNTFTVDGLWRALGLDKARTAPREHSGATHQDPQPQGAPVQAQEQPPAQTRNPQPNPEPEPTEHPTADVGDRIQNSLNQAWDHPEQLMKLGKWMRSNHPQDHRLQDIYQRYQELTTTPESAPSDPEIVDEPAREEPLPIPTGA